MKIKKQKKIRFLFVLLVFFVFFDFSFAASSPASQIALDFVYPVNPWEVVEGGGEFGAFRGNGVYHLGDDVGKPAGTPIRSVADGIVKHFGIHSRFGTVVLIEHELGSGEKVVALYGHLRHSDIPVLENQFVNKGEVIGFVGKSGAENGYWPEHLHFAVRKGEYVDVKKTWVYWGLGSKEEMKNWYNPSDFLSRRMTLLIDPYNLTKMVAAPANAGRAHIKMFDRGGMEIENSDIYAARFDFHPGADVAIGRTDDHGGRAIVVGMGKKSLPYLKVFDKNTKALLSKIKVFSKKFKVGLRVAAGDLDSDGIDELVAGSGPGKIAEIKVYNFFGKLIWKKYPFGKKFKGGLDVAAGDVDGDKIDEIIVGAGSGYRPYVRIYRADGKETKSFLAYGKRHRAGVRVAAADIDRDGMKEILTGPDKGGSPHLRVFEPDGKPRPLAFFPFDKNFRGGLDVAGADFDNDGKDEIIVSQASSGQTWIKVYRYRASRPILANFLAFDSDFEGGTNVAGMK